MAEYRFLRTRDGATGFAKAEVVSTESQSWSTALGDAVQELHALYGPAIQNGVHLAVAEQSRRQGPRFAVVVTSLLETVVDTSPDVVECAVAIATWKSFGNDEQDVQLTFVGGRWTASFV